MLSLVSLFCQNALLNSVFVNNVSVLSQCSSYIFTFKLLSLGIKTYFCQYIVQYSGFFKEMKLVIENKVSHNQIIID